MTNFKEAQAFQPGKLPLGKHWMKLCYCFKEAQTFQPGKLSALIPYNATAIRASKRPRPFSLGIGPVVTLGAQQVDSKSTSGNTFLISSSDRFNWPDILVASEFNTSKKLQSLYCAKRAQTEVAGEANR